MRGSVQDKRIGDGARGHPQVRSLRLGWRLTRSLMAFLRTSPRMLGDSGLSESVSTHNSSCVMTQMSRGREAFHDRAGPESQIDHLARRDIGVMEETGEARAE